MGPSPARRADLALAAGGGTGAALAAPAAASALGCVLRLSAAVAPCLLQGVGCTLGAVSGTASGAPGAPGAALALCGLGDASRLMHAASPAEKPRGRPDASGTPQPSATAPAKPPRQRVEQFATEGPGGAGETDGKTSRRFDGGSGGGGYRATGGPSGVAGSDGAVGGPPANSGQPLTGVAAEPSSLRERLACALKPLPQQATNVVLMQLHKSDISRILDYILLTGLDEILKVDAAAHALVAEGGGGSCQGGDPASETPASDEFMGWEKLGFEEPENSLLIKPRAERSLGEPERGPLSQPAAAKPGSQEPALHAEPALQEPALPALQEPALQGSRKPAVRAAGKKNQPAVLAVAMPARTLSIPARPIEEPPFMKTAVVSLTESSSSRLSPSDSSSDSRLQNGAPRDSAAKDSAPRDSAPKGSCPSDGNGGVASAAILSPACERARLALGVRLLRTRLVLLILSALHEWPYRTLRWLETHWYPPRTPVPSPADLRTAWDALPELLDARPRTKACADPATCLKTCNVRHVLQTLLATDRPLARKLDVRLTIARWDNAEMRGRVLRSRLPRLWEAVWRAASNVAAARGQLTPRTPGAGQRFDFRARTPSGEKNCSPGGGASGTWPFDPLPSPASSPPPSLSFFPGEAAGRDGFATAAGGATASPDGRDFLQDEVQTLCLALEFALDSNKVCKGFDEWSTAELSALARALENELKSAGAQGRESWEGDGDGDQVPAPAGRGPGIESRLPPAAAEASPGSATLQLLRRVEGELEQRAGEEAEQLRSPPEGAARGWRPPPPRRKRPPARRRVSAGSRQARPAGAARFSSPPGGRKLLREPKMAEGKLAEAKSASGKGG